MLEKLHEHGGRFEPVIGPTGLKSTTCSLPFPGLLPEPALHRSERMQGSIGLLTHSRRQVPLMTASIAQADASAAAQPSHSAHTAPSRVWSRSEIEALFALPLNDLLYRAQQVHRAHFDANAVQRSTLLSIKTGGCSEDCGYC